MITKVCDSCNKSFCHWPSEEGRRFCSEKCRRENLKSLRVDVKCASCGVGFSRRKAEVSKSGLAFCSSSCSAKYWNAGERSPKRKPQGKCRECSIPIKTCRKFCDDCGGGRGQQRGRKGSVENMTIREICDRYFNSPYFKSASIRSHSRKRFVKSNISNCCEMCSYGKFYEVCHIDAIKDFSLDTKISEVNALTNLIALCPNCHWEVDHGIASKERLREIVANREGPVGVEPTTLRLEGEVSIH